MSSGYTSNTEIATGSSWLRRISQQASPSAKQYARIVTTVKPLHCSNKSPSRMAAHDSELFDFQSISPPPQPLYFEPLGQSGQLIQSSTSLSLKRGRPTSDVDGNPSTMDVSKKRRLRKQLVTSRLSSPYSEPAAHIANGGRCKIALWARQRPSSTSGLRKAAMLNAAHLQMDPTTIAIEAACSHQSSAGVRNRRISFEEDKAPPVPCTYPALYLQNPNYRPSHSMVAASVDLSAPVLEQHTTQHMSNYNYDALDDDIDDRSHAIEDEEQDTYVPHPDFAKKPTVTSQSSMFVSPLPSPSPSPPRRPVGMAMPMAQHLPPTQQSADWTPTNTDALISPLTMPGQVDFESTMARWLNFDTRPPSPPDEGLLQWFRDRDMVFDVWQ